MRHRGLLAGSITIALVVVGCNGGKHESVKVATTTPRCGHAHHNSHAAAHEECGYPVVASLEGKRPTRARPAPRPSQPCSARSTVVFYAATDWRRLAETLARHADPCADYEISIPPVQAKDGTWTMPRRGQAALIRRLGPNFHALDAVRVDAWQPWLAQHPGKTWLDAGVEARRRMEAAGFDVARGETWAVNEFMLPIVSDPEVRRQMADFVRGLATGRPGRARGLVFHVVPLQDDSGIPEYKQQLEGWLRDGPFWEAMSRYVDVWAEEVYVDAGSCCVPGSSLAQRVANMNAYLQHPLLLARAGGNDVGPARAFLERAYVPLGNAAWEWSFGFGNTIVPLAQMGRLVSEQAFAMRVFSQSRQHGEAQRGLVQSFQMTSIFPRLTALESVQAAMVARERRNLDFVTRFHRSKAGEARELLESVGLSDVADRRAETLSHGDQRALDIALALATRPRVLLLDEPTAGMSPTETSRIRELVAGLGRQRGLTVLFSEHDMDVVFGISERVTVLHQGLVIAEGSPAEVQEDPQVMAVYLGAPEVAA